MRNRAHAEQASLAQPPVRGRSGAAEPLEAEALSAFALRLAMTLGAGILLSEGLSLMAAEAEPQERALLERLAEQVDREGRPLFEALAETGYFPEHYVHMVQIGELSGRLEQVSEALAAHYRREADLQAGLRQTLFYPAMMSLVLSGVVFLILAKVLPLFERAYRELGSTLTPLAALLLRLGRALEQAGTLLAGLMAAAALAGFYLLYTRRGRARFSALMARRASRGRLGEALSRAHFASGLALMLASGIELGAAVARAGELVRSDAVRRQLEALQCRMEAGEPFPRASADVGLFTGLDAGLLSSGFQTGGAERVLQQLADRLSDEATDRMERRIGLIEPVLVALLSGVIGLVLLSVMLPLIGVLSAVG
ncbi:MAG: hypothetical protein GXX99_00960 [Clostridiales bacterium]|nr:hypothetical protein [Clostridiales bacterium]